MNTIQHLQDLTSATDALTATLIGEAAALRVLADTLWASDPEVRPFRFAVEATDLTLLDDRAVIRALIHAARDDDSARFLVIATEYGMSFTVSRGVWDMFRRVIELAD